MTSGQRPNARPGAVAFDIVETTISLDGLRPRLVAAGLPEHTLETWFAGMLRDAFALDAIGIFHPFPAIARATLAARGLDADAVANVLEGFHELDAHPDAAPAMRALQREGVRVCALTNGSAEVTEAMIERNNLRDLVDELVSIAEVKRWKPARIVYDRAAARMGLTPDRMALFAAHPWDCAGAGRAGYLTGFVSRNGAGYPDVLPRPNYTDGALDGLAETILTLPPA